MSTSAVPNPTTTNSAPERLDPVLPTLFGDGYGIYEVNRKSFIASFLLNIAFVSMAAWVGTWTFTHAQELKQTATQMILLDETPILHPDKDVSGGGGGGGAHDKIETPKGAAPKQSLEQITPPAIKPPESAKLTAEPTVVVPPQVQLPHAGSLGNPLASITGPASMGTGLGGGLGSGTGTGIGSGQGPGVGPGRGGGYGGGLFRIGGGVSAPRPIYDPEPEYSEEARKAKWQGTVVLWVVVGPDGKVHDLRVVRSLGLGLDEKAMEAVKQYRFRPALLQGKPVPVAISVEVDFHIY